MASDILLESGTNELELLEFKVGNNYYGINVAKIKEILPYQKITPVPNAHPYIEGIFMPRDMIITLVDLAEALGLPKSSTPSSDMLIVTKFSMLTIAFRVHSVEGIHRVSWRDINKPDGTISDSNSIATGIVKIDGRLIIMIDFEKIISDISPDTGLKVSEVEDMTDRVKSEKLIIMAEDSPLLARLMKESLAKAGYNNIKHLGNGKDAWDLLSNYRDKGRVDEVKLIITDIEMPEMDGHRLTKLVKSDTKLADIPLIIFSSLITEEMKKKGETLGANAQLSKPEIGILVETIDKLILS